MDKMFVTRSEAAEILRVSEKSIDNYRANKQLPATKVSGRVLIPMEAINRLRAKALAGGAK